MTEILTPPEDITKEVDEYGNRLLSFLNTTRFPNELLIEPDNTAIKVADASDFNAELHALKPFAEQVVFTEMDWRFLAAAQLLVPLNLIPHWYIDWVEIQEPKPEEIGKDFVGLKYGEFYFGDFGLAERKLRSRKIAFDRKRDNSHRWLNIVINEQGQELRLTDTKLVETVSEELESGTARLIQIV